MKLRIFFCIIFCFLYVSQNLYSQPVVAKYKSEVDALFAKYQDTDNVKLFTAFGDLFGDVLLIKNKKRQAQSVKISGNSENKAAITSFISYTIKMKLNQGYKVVNVPYGWDEKEIEKIIKDRMDAKFKSKLSFMLMMKKENIFFSINVGCCQKNNENLSAKDYFWEIETRDTKR